MNQVNYKRAMYQVRIIHWFGYRKLIFLKIKRIKEQTLPHQDKWFHVQNLPAIKRKKKM